LDDTVADPSDVEEQPPAITARAIAMAGPWGPVYGPVDLEIPHGGVTVLLGPAGSGRTALLMTLAGRMKPLRGSLDVLGCTRAPAIFGQCALAGIEDVDGVYESVTVRDVLTEQLRWDAAWYRLVRRAGGDDLARICGAVFGPRPLPELGAYVDQLTELDAMLLRIALANTASPPVLVVGSLDQVDDDGDRAELVRRLVALGEQQTIVTASANPVADDIGVRAQFPVANLSLAETSTRDQKGTA
jgi:energy-coupling factor transporter ATP-binding protein EcfA2